MIDPNNPVARGYSDPNLIGRANANTQQASIDNHNQAVGLQRALAAKAQGVQTGALNPDNVPTPNFAPDFTGGGNNWLQALLAQ